MEPYDIDLIEGMPVFAPTNLYLHGYDTVGQNFNFKVETRTRNGAAIVDRIIQAQRMGKVPMLHYRNPTTLLTESVPVMSAQTRSTPYGDIVTLFVTYINE